MPDPIWAGIPPSSFRGLLFALMSVFVNPQLLHAMDIANALVDLTENILIWEMVPDSW
jgi:hypothetical protein